MIPLILLASLKGIATFGTSSLDKNTLQIFNLVSGCIDMLVVFLALLKQLVNPGKTSYQFHAIGKRYSVMNNDFKRILVENVNERPNGTIYLREKNKERNDLYVNTPQISNKTWNKLYDEMATGKILDIDNSVYIKRTMYQKRNISSIQTEDIIKTKPVKKSIDTSIDTSIEIPDIDQHNIKLDLPINDRSRLTREKIRATMKKTLFHINKS